MILTGSLVAILLIVVAIFFAIVFPPADGPLDQGSILDMFRDRYIFPKKGKRPLAKATDKVKIKGKTSKKTVKRRK